MPVSNIFCKMYQWMETEWFELEGTVKTIQLHPPCHGQGHPPLNQVAQSPIQPGRGNFQGWGIHNVCRQPVQVSHHSHCEGSEDMLDISSWCDLTLTHPIADTAPCTHLIQGLTCGHRPIHHNQQCPHDPPI